MFTSSLIAETDIFHNSLDFKEGIINYTIRGSESGTKSMYLKDYGKTRLIYTEVKSNFMRQTREVKQITQITPKWVYKTNLKTNVTTKTYNLNYLLNQRVEKLTMTQKKRLEQNLQKTKSLQSKEILGYFCDHKVIDGVSTYSVTNYDLVLKTQIDILGFHSKTEAIQIEKKDIDHNIFKRIQTLSITPTPEKNQALEQKADHIIQNLLTRIMQ